MREFMEVYGATVRNEVIYLIYVNRLARTSRHVHLAPARAGRALSGENVNERADLKNLEADERRER